MNGDEVNLLLKPVIERVMRELYLVNYEVAFTEYTMGIINKSRTGKNYDYTIGIADGEIYIIKNCVEDESILSTGSEFCSAIWKFPTWAIDDLMIILKRNFYSKKEMKHP